MKCYTIGYGGRKPNDFISLLQQHDVHLVIDVRIEPTRASMGSYVKAKEPSKGIEGLLGKHGITYLHIQELGNPYRENEKWQEPFEKHLIDNGNKLLSQLVKINEPFCLLCAERRVEKDGLINCHRKVIADYLVSMTDLGSYEFTHIE